MVRAGMSYLSAADPAELPSVVQGQCLQELERFHGLETAARTRILGAFTAERVFREDACYSARSWLVHQTRVTGIRDLAALRVDRRGQPRQVPQPHPRQGRVDQQLIGRLAGVFGELIGPGADPRGPGL